ncbi:MAG: hypothetical protein L3J69_13255 [Desulfobacula sp.]|nr:hypothetical protein [Desulfobacula sp.]
MRTLVCFKTMPDIGLISSRDWKISDDMSVDLRFVKHIFNCFDESALEMALKLSDLTSSTDSPFDLTALTIDDDSADLFLKHLLAVQYNTAVRIHPDRGFDLRFNALSLSRLIYSYVKKIGGQGLVILGAQGSIGDNGQTGLLVAERLGWPCINNVSDLKPGPSYHSLDVTSRQDGAVMIQTIALPMVLIIANAPDSPYLRVPTLKQKLDVGEKKISVLSPADLGVDKKNLGNDKTLMELQKKQMRHTCKIISGSSPKEKAQHLFDRYLKKRLTG